MRTKPTAGWIVAVLACAVGATTAATDRPDWVDRTIAVERDAWSGEAQSDAAGKLLKELAKAIEHGDSVSFSWIDSDSKVSRLIPTRSVSRHDDGRLLLRTGEFSVAEPKPATAALEGWVRSFSDLVDRRVKLKVTGVERSPSDDSAFTTRVRVQIVGTGSDGRRQIDAVWRAEWRRQPLLLTAVNAVEQTEAIDRAADVWFEDCTESALRGQVELTDQLRHGTEYWLRRIQSVEGIDNYGHNGLAVADVDGDGLEDVYVCQAGGLPNRLLIHRPDGTVRDVAADAGVDFLERTHAALLVDLDNDGDADLVVGTQHEVRVLLNDGGGRFELGATVEPANAYSFAAADYDRDGDLDLYVTQYADPSMLDDQAGIGLHPVPYHDANNGAPNTLYRNDGKGDLTDVTEQVGLNANNRRWSFAAGWEDYDEDGDLDLYVANDFGRNNLYRNDDGRFVDVAAEAGVEDVASGMSVNWGDYDRDGHVDLYVGNMYSSAGNRIAYQRGFQSDADGDTRQQFQRLARGNSLFRNTGDGRFVDRSLEAGVTEGLWAWASVFGDLDNDGWRDLVVTNGYITNEDTGDL